MVGKARVTTGTAFKRMGWTAAWYPRPSTRTEQAHQTIFQMVDKPCKQIAPSHAECACHTGDKRDPSWTWAQLLCRASAAHHQLCSTSTPRCMAHNSCISLSAFVCMHSVQSNAIQCSFSIIQQASVATNAQLKALHHQHAPRTTVRRGVDCRGPRSGTAEVAGTEGV